MPACYWGECKFLAEKASAYWLIDKVATLQLEPKIKREEFQVWKLFVADSKATLVCEDGNYNAHAMPVVPL